MGVRRRTVRDVIMYEYSKLIADAAVGGRSSLAPVTRDLPPNNRASLRVRI